MKYVLRMFGEHLLSGALSLILMFPLVLLAGDADVYKLIIGVVLVAFYWFIAGSYFVKQGKKDAREGKTSVKSVLLSSVVFMIPDMIFTVAITLLSGTDWFDLLMLVFRYWNIAYLNLLLVSGAPTAALVLITISYALGFVAAYYIGILKKKKDDRMILRKETKEDDE